MPADVHVLCDRRDEFGRNLERIGDRRSGAPLPAPRGREPRRVHGNGRAVPERGRGAGLRRAPPDLGITHRRTTISTVGWMPGLQRFVNEVETADPARTLAARGGSRRRSELMPVNDRYPLPEVLAECVGTSHSGAGRSSSNTSCSPGQRLAGARPRARRGARPRAFKVNLIPYNPTGTFEGSSRQVIEAFKGVLDRARIPATVRLTRGRDIEAACGQLAAAPRQSKAARPRYRV